MDDLTGKQFGPYEIGEPLGEGGMAAVYKAYQPSMDRYVAIKVLPRQMSKSSEFTTRFKREARMLAQLQHPHILPIFDYGQDDGYSYIVMPLMQNGSLADLLEKRRLTLSEIRRVVSQVGDALGYAHVRGMMHRDVKPSNVLMDESGNYLLTDFGLARMTEASVKLTSSGAIMGTPAYMSPEQGSGPNVDGRSDLYSLGVMLYEMVTGQMPFTADTPFALVFKHMLDPLPSPRTLVPDISYALELVIIKSLAKKPADRYQTAEDFVKAVDEAIPPTGKSNPPPPQPTAYQATKVSMPPQVRRPAPMPETVASMPPVPRSVMKPPSQPPAARPASGMQSRTPAPAPRRGFWPWLFAGGGIFLGVCLVGLVLGVVGLYSMGYGPIFTVVTSPTVQPTVVITATSEFVVRATDTLAAETTPEPTIEVEIIPILPDPPTLVVPPDTEFARINAITVNSQNQYVTEYETFEYTEANIGMHIHFFFNIVSPQNAGMPGSGPWKVYGGPRPFKAYRTTDRPANASQLCVLVANANHSIIEDSGNCFPLPDVATVTARLDIECLKTPTETGEALVTFEAGATSLLKGFSSDKSWFYIQNPVAVNNTTCWVPIESAVTGGDVSHLPTVDP